MAAQARLIGLSGEYGGSTFPITKDRSLIGRGEDCDLQIVDARISRNHAQLLLEGGTWELEDLGSTHGTFVKGERIEKAILAHGDTITIGETILRFEDPDAQDAIPTEMASPDDTPTILETPGTPPIESPSLDDVATVLASPDDQPTQLVAADDQETALAADQIEPSAAEGVASESSAVKAFPPPKPPPLPPDAEKKPFPWIWVAVGAGVLVVVLVVWVGLRLLGGLLGDRQASDPELRRISDDSIVLTIEAQTESIDVSTPLIPATLTPTPEAQQTAGVTPGTPGETEQPAQEASPGSGNQLLPIIGGSAQISFASDRSGRPQIYLVDLANRTEVELTDASGGACQPAWSADGTRLAYTSPCNTNREEYSGSSVFVMEVDSAGNPGVITQLITTVGGGDYDPAWSRDGSRIAFTSWRTGRPQIFTTNPDGSDLRNLNDDLAFNWAPTWSHDGATLAFLTGRGGAEEIWTIPAGGGEERRFSRSDGKDVARPDWSPDGSTIVFEKIVGNIPRLIAAPVADGGVRELQVCQEGNLSLQPMGEPVWSPDGNWLAFETWPDGVNHEIAILRSNCTEYQLLTSADSLEFDAAWRPIP